MTDTFFDDMQHISDFIFDMLTLAWNAITGNILLTLSFAIVVLGFIVGILYRIKHIRKH